MKMLTAGSRRSVVFAMAIAAVALAMPAPTVAGTVGTQAFADFGVPLANGSSTGDINSATLFTIGDLETTATASGYFAGLFSGGNSQAFGAITFDVEIPTSLVFGNPFFGQFVSTAIVQTSNVVGTPSTPGTRGFSILGNYTGGTAGGLTSPSPTRSLLSISFNQTAGGSISDNSTLAIGISPVPEPTSILLACVGIVGTAAIAKARRPRRVSSPQTATIA